MQVKRVKAKDIMVRIETVNTLEGFQALMPIWDSLLVKSGSDMPFLKYEWLSCWWKGFGGDSELMILIAKEQDEIVGIAPLMKTRIKRRGFWFSAITFMANYHSNRIDFILTGYKQELLGAMIEHLRVNYPSVDLYLFDFLVKDSENEKMLSDILSRKRKKFIKMGSISSPFMKVTESWDEYFKARPAKMRHKFNHFSKKLKPSGDYEIVKYANQDIGAAMNSVLDISRNTWSHKEGTSIASSVENIEFYGSLAKSASDKGWLNIWILKNTAGPIAFLYGLVFGGTVFVLKIGYDEKYSKETPGEFLNNIVIKECYDAKMAEYDWLGDKNEYKLRWTSLSRDHVKYLVFNNTPRGNLLCFIEASAMPLFKAICRIQNKTINKVFTKYSEDKKD